MGKRTPKLCHHKASNQAYIRVDGKQRYLGIWGSDEAYDAIVAKLKRDDELGHCRLTIGELALTYLEFTDGYYVRDGKPISEAHVNRIAFKPLVKRYRRLLAKDFAPHHLKAVRDDMVANDWVRKSINRHVGRICRMFKWGVSEGVVPVETYMALTTLWGLKAGRCKASEGAPVPVLPVPDEDIEAVKPFVSRQVWAVFQLRLLTGGRPTEILTTRECDTDATGDVWEYQPERHKTQHHGKQRTIFIGPKAQQIVTEFIRGDATRYLFSPAEARAGFDAARKANRKTPMTPSQRKRKPKAKPIKAPGDRYQIASYGRAIAEACRKAKVAKWSPGQLRHNATTTLNQTFGDIDAARVVLGHSEQSTTQVYALRDQQAARAIASKIG